MDLYHAHRARKVSPAADRLEQELATSAASGRNAGRIVDAMFAGVIDALRRDRRFHNIPRYDLEVMTADVRAATERDLFEALSGMLHHERAAEIAFAVYEGIGVISYGD